MNARHKRLKKAANAQYERLLGGGPEKKKKKKEEMGQSVLFFPCSQLCVRRCVRVLWCMSIWK